MSYEQASIEYDDPWVFGLLAGRFFIVNTLTGKKYVDYYPIFKMTMFR